MLRYLALLAALVPSLAASGSSGCFPQPFACGREIHGQLQEPFTCHFSDTGEPFIFYEIEAPSGTVFTIDVTSADFAPRVGVYRKSGGSPLKRAVATGTGSVQLQFEVEHSSLYRIAVSANDGARSGAFTLKLTCSVNCHIPFTITPTTAMTVSRGEVVLIPFPVDGTPALQWRWFDAADPSVTLSTNPEYFITPPMLESATFHVTVSNACGELTRPAAIVTVSDCVGAHIAEAPHDVTVEPGETATFTVLAGGQAPIVYSWYEGTPPNTANQLYSQTGPTLTVPNARKNATYWVRVANACGIENSRPVHLFVVEPRRRSVRH